MVLHADFSKRIVVHSDELPWQSSPMVGVERRPLDRVGDEVARATSIVRYAPNSYFSPHIHSGGEEFFVLEGVFQDEHGDFPAGSYIRNPPTSSHTPGSREGCTIFVKLWQFEPEDRTHIRLNTRFMSAVSHQDYAGLHLTPLYNDPVEQVSLIRLDAHTAVELPITNGAEVLVLAGSMTHSGDVLPSSVLQTSVLQTYSWLRLPVTESLLTLVSGEEGVTFWCKQGHLARVEQEVYRVSSSV